MAPCRCRSTPPATTPPRTSSGTSFTAPQISGAVAYLCGQNPALQPQAAFDDLLANRPTLDKFGVVVHLLRGTPRLPTALERHHTENRDDIIMVPGEQYNQASWDAPVRLLQNHFV